METSPTLTGEVGPGEVGLLPSDVRAIARYCVTYASTVATTSARRSQLGSCPLRPSPVLRYSLVIFATPLFAKLLSRGPLGGKPLIVDRLVLK